MAWVKFGLCLFVCLSSLSTSLSAQSILDYIPDPRLPEDGRVVDVGIKSEGETVLRVDYMINLHSNGAPLAWSPDSKRIAIVNAGKLRLLDISSRRIRVSDPSKSATSPLAIRWNESGPDKPSSLAWSPSGQYLAAIVPGSPYEIRLFNANNMRLIGKFRGPTEAASSSIKSKRSIKLQGLYFTANGKGLWVDAVVRGFNRNPIAFKLSIPNLKKVAEVQPRVPTGFGKPLLQRGAALVSIRGKPVLITKVWSPYYQIENGIRKRIGGSYSTPYGKWFIVGYDLERNDLLFNIIKLPSVAIKANSNTFAHSASLPQALVPITADLRRLGVIGRYPADNVFVSKSKDYYQVLIYDTTFGSIVSRLILTNKKEDLSVVSAVSLPRRSLLFVAYQTIKNNGGILVLNYSNNKTIQKISFRNIRNLSISPDGRKLMAGGKSLVSFFSVVEPTTKE